MLMNTSVDFNESVTRDQDFGCNESLTRGDRSEMLVSRIVTRILLNCVAKGQLLDSSNVSVERRGEWLFYGESGQLSKYE